MVLVTGSTGLLGSHLLIELVKHHTRIRASYRNESKIKEVKKLFRFYFKNDFDNLFQKIEWVECDLLNLDQLNELFQGVDYVYHCSGKVSFFKSDFNACFRQNRDVTSNIVNYCLQFQVKKLCHVSSTAAIGNNSVGLTTESDKWENGRTISGYSVTKFSAEKEVWRGVEEGLDAVIINPCVILGPGDWNESSLTIFRSAQNGISFYPNGKNAIVDVRDVAKSMRLLMESTICSERFLCTGLNISFKELITQITKKFDRKPPSIAAPYWLTWLVAFVLETWSRISNKKTGLSLETVYSAYKVIEYDSTKLKKAIGIQFRTLSETVDNVISFKHFD
jgi:nucleoside-diphosphate-sugar epimerase